MRARANRPPRPRRGRGGTAAPRGVVAALAGAVAALAVTALWLSPALGDGVLLYRDFVQVPEPVLGPAALGADGRAPRAVPLDAVTALLAPVVPSGLQQQLMLLASLALAGCGTAVLLRGHGVAPAVTGAVLATWSPYAAERLLLGQPPTLLGWAMTPWLVLAVRIRGPARRRVLAVALAALPAALTPFGGLLAAATVLLAWPTRDTGRVSASAAAPGSHPRGSRWEPGALVALAVAWCLPWIIVALRGATGAGEGDGAAAFAVRADDALAVVDVVGGGGIWAPAAGLASRAEAPAPAASLLLVGLALLAAAALRRPGGPGGPGGPGPEGRPAGPSRREVILLVAAVVLPPLLALALATPAGLALWASAQAFPGVGLLRDTHRLLGISTLGVAVLVALGVARVRDAVAGAGGSGGRRRGHRPGRASVTAAAAALLTGSLAVLGAPDAPARLRTTYRPVAFPDGWQESVDAVGARTALVLPWQPFRRQAWAGPHPFLDPLPLALRGRAASSGELTVLRDGAILRVGRGDPAAAQAWARGDVAALRRVGITAVLAWRNAPGATVHPVGPTVPPERPGTGPLRVWILDE